MSRKSVTMEPPDPLDGLTTPTSPPPVTSDTAAPLSDAALEKELARLQTKAGELERAAGRLDNTALDEWTPDAINTAATAKRQLAEALRGLLIRQRQYIPIARAKDAAENLNLREKYAREWPQDVCGGADRVIEQVAVALEKLGFDPNWLRTSADRGPELRAIVIERCIPFREAVIAERAWFNRPPCPTTTANVDRANATIANTEDRLRRIVGDVLAAAK